MNTQDKDFIDNFLNFFKPYHKEGIRFLAVTICFALFLLVGLFLSPWIIRELQNILPFTVEFLQLSPLEVLFNYIKTGFFFSFFITMPVFIYQFGKLKIEKDVFEQRINLLYFSLGVALIIFGSILLSYFFFYPWQIMFLYGLNFNVAYFSSSLSAIVSSFILTIFITSMLALLPLLRNLIKKSMLYNYATFIQYKRPVIAYSVILSALIVLPMELMALGAVFFVFFFWYKILVNFSKKRD